jgi:hypothetical protein
MEKRKEIVVKSVAFNLADPDQRKMYEWMTRRTNFSAYLKRLIQRDMEGGNARGLTEDGVN